MKYKELVTTKFPHTCKKGLRFIEKHKSSTVEEVLSDNKMGMDYFFMAASVLGASDATLRKMFKRILNLIEDQVLDPDDKVEGLLLDMKKGRRRNWGKEVDIEGDWSPLFQKIAILSACLSSCSVDLLRPELKKMCLQAHKKFRVRVSATHE